MDRTTAALVGIGMLAGAAPAQVWHDGAAPRPAARALAAALDTLDRDGLQPEDYAAARIRRLLAAPSSDSLTILERLLTAAAHDAARDLAIGRRDPASLDSLWSGTRDTAGLEAVLAAARQGADPAATLAGLAPRFPEYRALRAALGRYRAIAAAGGWPTVPAAGRLARGDTGVTVTILRTRLAAEGDLSAGSVPRFDTGLERAVRRFQARLGLDTTGLVDAATRAALSVPAGVRVRQLALALERWRWVPRVPTQQQLIVNAAAFAAELDSGGRPVWSSRVVVGRDDWPTPITTGPLRTVVFAPRWNVPGDIARQEILPAVRDDSTWLVRQGVLAFDSSGFAVDPAAACRLAAADSAPALRFVQGAGPTNPLGNVKFVFANPFNVALHATPDRSLFAEPVRMFSHGCIRVEHAGALARGLLAPLPDWPTDAVARALADTVELPVAVPPGTLVIVGYWTAWVDRAGTVHFRPDRYGWDAKLAAALGR